MNQAQGQHPPLWLSWLVWGLGALFYLIGFFHRMSPAVMTAELMRGFQIGAAGLGNLSAFYFYAYVAMQVPTGILADNWGPRRLLTAGAFTAAVGALVFATAPDLLLAGLGRLLIGGSVAVAFVVLLKVAAHWFPPRLFATVSGMALFFGVMGAVSAGTPLRLLVDAFGWREVTLAAGVITLVVALASWLVIRDDPSQRGYATYADANPDDAQAPRIGVWAGLAKVLGYRNNWLLFLAPGGIVGPVLAFSGLWGVPYLKARYGLDPAEGAIITSILMVGWAVGSPLMGWLSDRIGRRRPLYLAGTLVSLLGWAAMVYIPGLPLWAFGLLAAIAGLAAGGMILSFVFAKESTPPRLAGTVSGLINMGVMLGPTVLQPVMGAILDANWQGEIVEGARIYSVDAYQTAFLPMMVWAFLGCVFLALTKETHCRQMVR